jgi:hypothetical protein
MEDGSSDVTDTESESVMSNGHMNRRHKDKLRRDWEIQPAGTAFVLRRIRYHGPGWMRLILPPMDGKLQRVSKDMRDWAKRVNKHLKGRLPGNWTTKRGIKKREQFLFRNFPVN